MANQCITNLEGELAKVIERLETQEVENWNKE